MYTATRSIILLALLLFLAACGVRFFYHQLDWLVPWYLRDYITLDDSQKSLLEKRLDATLDWHCRTQLPGYVVWLREADTMLRGDRVAVHQLEVLAEQAEYFWRDLMQAVAPDVAAILATASDAQIEELYANFSTRNAGSREEYVEPALEDRQAGQAERMEQRLRRWFGRLSNEQRERVHEWSRSLHPVSAEWLENRIHWQSRLRDAIDQRNHADAFQARIAELLVHPDAHWRQEYRSRVADNRMLTLELLADLHALANERQRGRLQSRLVGWADSFEQAICTVNAD